MKKSGILCIILLATGAFKTAAQSRNLAAGIRFSSNDAVVNTGITMRSFLKGNIALEAIVSFNPASVGFLAERFKPLSAKGLSWFYGGGVYAAFEDSNVAGAMGIIGLDYSFTAIPLNLSLDWKPELFLINDVAFEPAAVGLSVRFAF